MNKEKLLGSLASVGIVAAIIVAVVVLFSGWSTINEGHRGVYVCWGERVNEQPVQPGFHWKTPAVCGYTELNVRVQDGKMQEAVKTSSGLDAKMTATLRYRLNEEKVNWIYDNLGGRKAIAEKVKNSFQGAMKEAADQFSDEQLYTTESKAYENEVEKIVKGQLEPLGFTVDDVILNNVNFNKELEREITKKRTMEQKKQRKEKQVEVARAEAKRKKAEARGIRDAENIIAEANFSDRYLQYLTIQMLKETENQVIYLPMNSGNLQLMKDIDKNKLEQMKN